MKELLLYSLFITLSFLLVICSPIVIGNQLMDLNGDDFRYIKFCQNILSLFGVTHMLFKTIYNFLASLIETKTGFNPSRNTNEAPKSLFALGCF